MDSIFMKSVWVTQTGKNNKNKKQKQLFFEVT